MRLFWVALTIGWFAVAEDESDGGIGKPMISLLEWTDLFNLPVNVPYYDSKITITCALPTVKDRIESVCNGFDNIELLADDAIVNTWICDKTGKSYYYDLKFNDEMKFGDYRCHYRNRYSTDKIPIHFRFCGPHEDVCVDMHKNNCTDEMFCIVNAKGRLPCGTTIDPSKCLIPENILYCPMNAFSSHCKGVLSGKMKEYVLQAPGSNTCPKKPTPSLVIKAAATGRQYYITDPHLQDASTIPFDHSFHVNQSFGVSFYVNCGSTNYKKVNCHLLKKDIAIETMDLANSKTRDQMPTKNCTATESIEYSMPSAIFNNGIQVNRLVCVLNDFQDENHYLQAFVVIFGGRMIIRPLPSASKPKLLKCQLNPPSSEKLRISCIWAIVSPTTIEPPNNKMNKTSKRSFNPSHFTTQKGATDTIELAKLVPGKLYECYCTVIYQSCTPYKEFTAQYTSDTFYVRRTIMSKSTTAKKDTATKKTTTTKTTIMAQKIKTDSMMSLASRANTDLFWIVGILAMSKKITIPALALIVLFVPSEKTLHCYNCSGIDTTYKIGLRNDTLCPTSMCPIDSIRQFKKRDNTDYGLKIQRLPRLCSYCTCEMDFCEGTSSSQRVASSSLSTTSALVATPTTNQIPKLTLTPLTKATATFSITVSKPTNLKYSAVKISNSTADNNAASTFFVIAAVLAFSDVFTAVASMI